MFFDSATLDSLAKEVAKRLSTHRMAHTLRVREMAALMCERLSIAEHTEIEAAALLHDVAKEESLEQQLHLALESATIDNMAEGELYAPVLHGYAAIPLICREFPAFATENILDAVCYHTTGKPQMSVFTAIVFLADYIEAGRKQPSCIEARELFFEKTAQGSIDERSRALDECVCFALEKTKAFLESSHSAMHPDTESALIYYQSKLDLSNSLNKD